MDIEKGLQERLDQMMAAQRQRAKARAAEINSKQKRSFGPHTVLPNGDVEYTKREGDWEPPPSLDGFKRDLMNPWYFYRVWPECDQRDLKLKVLQRCGCVKAHAICNHPDAPTNGQRVSFAVCMACPLKPAGVLDMSQEQAKPCVGCPESATMAGVDSVKLKIPNLFTAPRYKPGYHPHYALQQTLPFDTVQRAFPKPFFHPNGDIEFPRLEAAAKEPDDIDGYERTKENPWRFRPIILDCQLRFAGAVFKESGCVEVKYGCQNPEAKQFNLPVVNHDCQNCPVRKPKQS